MSSHKLLSLFEAIFKFKLLGPHCVTAGKAGFQLMGPHVEVQRMCLPSWREESNFGWGKHCLFARTLASRSPVSAGNAFSHSSLVWTPAHSVREQGISV